MARVFPEGESRPQTKLEKLIYTHPNRAEAPGERTIERHPIQRVQIVDRVPTLIDQLRYPTAQAFAPEDLEGVRQRYNYLLETRTRIQDPVTQIITASDKFWETFQDVMASPDSERKSYEEIKKILHIVQMRGNLFSFNRNKVVAHLRALDRCPLDLIPVVLDFVRKYKLHTTPLRESHGAFPPGTNSYPPGSQDKTPLFNSKDKQRQEEMDRLRQEEQTQDNALQFLDRIAKEKMAEFKTEDVELPRSGSELHRSGRGLTRYPLLYSLSKPHIRSIKNRGSGLNRSNALESTIRSYEL